MKIGNREFEIGAVYHRKYFNVKRAEPRLRRKFLGPHTPSPDASGNEWVSYEGWQGVRCITVNGWAAWAGEKVAEAETAETLHGQE